MKGVFMKDNLMQSRFYYKENTQHTEYKEYEECEEYEEYEEYKKLVQLYANIRRMPFPEWVFVADISDEQETRKLLDLIIIIMKLFKDNTILACFYSEKIHFSGVPHYTVWRREPLYKLTSREVPRFQDFWRHYRKISLGNFAVNMFSIADYLPYNIHTFLNYVAALEYLFCPDNRQELKYRFSLTGSLILSSLLNKKRENIFEELQNIYKKRSEIIHGHEKEVKITNPDLLKLRNYCRCAIIYSFDQGLFDKSPKARRKLLEKKVLDGKP